MALRTAVETTAVRRAAIPPYTTEQAPAEGAASPSGLAASRARPTVETTVGLTGWLSKQQPASTLPDRRNNGLSAYSRRTVETTVLSRRRSGCRSNTHCSSAWVSKQHPGCRAVGTALYTTEQAPPVHGTGPHRSLQAIADLPPSICSKKSAAPPSLAIARPSLQSAATCRGLHARDCLRGSPCAAAVAAEEGVGMFHSSFTVIVARLLHARFAARQGRWPCWEDC